MKEEYGKLIAVLENKNKKKLYVTKKEKYFTLYEGKKETMNDLKKCETWPEEVIKLLCKNYIKQIIDNIFK